MRCDPYLLVKLDNEQEVREMTEAMYTDAELKRGDFVCKVTSIKVERAGNKLYGDYRIEAVANLSVVRWHEDN